MINNQRSDKFLSDLLGFNCYIIKKKKPIKKI